MATTEPLGTTVGDHTRAFTTPSGTSSVLRVALLEDDDVDATRFSDLAARAWPAGVSIHRFHGLAELEVGLADLGADIVFCDLSVPDGQGIELVERVVSQAGTAPVVVLTGTDDPSLPVRTLEVGAEDHLTKGAIDTELLARTLRHSLARSRADETLRQLADDLRTANAELEEYLGIMAHDLRAPLRTGRMFADRLVAANRSGDDAEPLAAALEASLGQMEAMMEHLLRLAGLRQGQLELVEERLSDAVAAVSADLGPELDRVGGRFDLDGDGTVLVDRALFHDLLGQLAENSIRFRSPHRPLIVGFRAECLGSSTIVAVRDNGIGIAPDYRDRVFGLFERLEPDGDGLGFGLALCRRIAELHRATVTLVSTSDDVGIEGRIHFPSGE